MGSIFDLSGKVALVTGASGGLGLHFARTLAEAGAKVALAARRKDQLEANVATIGRRECHRGRHGRDRACQRRARHRRGRGAARAGQHRRQQFRCHRHAVRTRSRCGRVGQDHGHQPQGRVARRPGGGQAPDRGQAPAAASSTSPRSWASVAGHVAPYAASKAGLVQLTQALALEWARYRHPRQRHRAGLYRDRPQPRLFRLRRRQGDHRADTAAPAGPARRTSTAPCCCWPRMRRLHDRRSTIVVDGGHLQSTL